MSCWRRVRYVLGVTARSLSPTAALAALGLCLTLAGCPETGSPPTPPSPPPAATPESEPPETPPATGALRNRVVYVPAYSHLGAASGRRTLFSITLSVRNVDPTATVRLTHVDYFDTSGHRVRRYLTRPRTLRPLETADFLVETLDETGGSGANFLVYWEGPSDAHALLTETVMVGQVGSAYIGFTSRGVELDRDPQLEGARSEAPPAP